MIASQQTALFEQVDFLPIDLKTKLVDRLLNSITPKNQSIDELWIQEANKRKREIENQTVSLLDGKEVFQKIFQKYQA
jgi:hypothetical protein